MKKSHIILVALVMLGLLVGCSKETSSSVAVDAEKVVEHDSDGQEKSREYVDRNPNVKRTKTWTFIDGFDSNGKKESSGYVLKDKTKVGYWVHWYENGQKKRESEFKENGEKHAHWTHWYENGQKEKEGEYKGGEQEGRWTYWNEDGSIDNEKSGIYKNDERVAPLPNKK